MSDVGCCQRRPRRGDGHAGRLLARIGMIQSRLPLLQIVVAAAIFAWGAIGVSRLHRRSRPSAPTW